MFVAAKQDDSVQAMNRTKTLPRHGSGGVRAAFASSARIAADMPPWRRPPAPPAFAAACVVAPRNRQAGDHA